MHVVYRTLQTFYAWSAEFAAAAMVPGMDCRALQELFPSAAAAEKKIDRTFQSLGQATWSAVVGSVSLHGEEL